MNRFILDLNLYNSDFLERALQKLGFVKENVYDSYHHPHSWYYSIPHGFKLFQVSHRDFYYILDSNGNVVLSYRKRMLHVLADNHKHGEFIAGDYWIWLYKEPYLVIPDSDLEPMNQNVRFILKTNSNPILCEWEQEQIHKFKSQSEAPTGQAWERPVGTVEHVVLKR